MANIKIEIQGQDAVAATEELFLTLERMRESVQSV
jgi:hypothetical protein